LAQNEFLSDRYVQHKPDGTSFDLGVKYLEVWQFRTNPAFKWAGIFYMLAMFCIFTAMSTYSLYSIRYPLSTGTRRNAAQEEKAIKDEEKQWALEQQRLQQQADGHVAVNIPNMPILRQVSLSSVAFNSADCKSMLLEPKDLSWCELCYTVSLLDGSEKQLLRNVSGFARAGQCTALMGASGAGLVQFTKIVYLLTKRTIYSHKLDRLKLCCFVLKFQ